jgi:hypothetical protein
MKSEAHVERTARCRVIGAAGSRIAAALLVAVASSSCGDMQLEGTASSYLIVNTLEASSGAQPGTFGTTLSSDVVTFVNGTRTVFPDVGRVTLSLGLKDAGPASNPAQPSAVNAVTVTQYHVRFIRADGRNTPGVDVPYAFDGAFTTTVTSGAVSSGFTLVRNLAKSEAPLAALGSNGLVISTIAEVTFYGHDQTGREVSATGRISVDFGNFADPQVDLGTGQ